MDNSHVKLYILLIVILVILFSVPSTPRMMQMTMMRGSTPGGSYRMMMVEKKKMMNMMSQYPAPAPAQQSYGNPQASQEKPTKVVVVKVQPMMMQPPMEDCIVPVDICKNAMMPSMMMYGGGGDR